MKARSWNPQLSGLTVKQTHDRLIHLLKVKPTSTEIAGLVSTLEQEQPADLNRDGPLLRGVWDLRWSSSSQPWLRQAPWLENLQILEPEKGRGRNCLKLAGPLGAIASIQVEAVLEVVSEKRVEVRFRRGGWMGPQLGRFRLQLMREVNQSFPAWLDITVLDQELRICRGNAGTTFCLLRNTELSVEDCFRDVQKE